MQSSGSHQYGHGADVIVLGADVYHAPPDSDRSSFAAVVGSMDRWLCNYHSTISAQRTKLGEL